MLSAPVNSPRFCASPAVVLATRNSKRCERCILAASKKVVWVQTTNQAVLTAAVESGYNQALFTQETQQLAEQWAKLASFESLLVLPDGVIQDGTKRQVGRLLVVSSKDDLAAAEAAAQQPGHLVMDATDWKVSRKFVIETCDTAAAARAGSGTGATAGAAAAAGAVAAAVVFRSSWVPS